MSQTYTLLNYVPEVYRSPLAENVTTQFIDPALNDDQLFGSGLGTTSDLKWAIRTSTQTITNQELRNAYERMGIITTPSHVTNMEFHLPIDYAKLAKPDDYIWAHDSEPKYVVVDGGDTTGWGSHNHWVHRNDASFEQLATYNHGTSPIVEFHSNITRSDWAYLKRTWAYNGKVTTQEPTAFDIGAIRTVDIKNGEVTMSGDLVDDLTRHKSFWLMFSNVDIRAVGVIHVEYDADANITRMMTDLNRTATNIDMIPTSDSMGGDILDSADVSQLFTQRWELKGEEWIATEYTGTFKWIEEVEDTATGSIHSIIQFLVTSAL